MFHSCEKLEPAPPGATLEQVFNGERKKQIHFLKAKLGEDAVRKAFRERLLISCGNGLARLAGVVTK